MELTFIAPSYSPKQLPSGRREGHYGVTSKLTEWGDTRNITEGTPTVSRPKYIYYIRSYNKEILRKISPLNFCVKDLNFLCFKLQHKAITVNLGFRRFSRPPKNISNIWISLVSRGHRRLDHTMGGGVRKEFKQRKWYSKCYYVASVTKTFTLANKLSVVQRNTALQ
jgi:hypothetical protein